jgi:hypothetical protein
VWRITAVSREGMDVLLERLVVHRLAIRELQKRECGGATKSSYFISHSNKSCCGHVRWENHPLTPARRRLAVHERAPPAASELKTFRV